MSELVDLIESPVITPDESTRCYVDLVVYSGSSGRGLLVPCGPGLGHGTFPFVPEVKVREREHLAVWTARREDLEQVKKGRLVHLTFDADSDVMSAWRAMFEAGYSSTMHFEKVIEASDLCKERRQSPHVENTSFASDAPELADFTSTSTTSDGPTPVPTNDSSAQNISIPSSVGSQDSGLLPYTVS